MENYKGYLDQVDANQVTGWAAKEGDPTPQEVQLWVNEKPVATAAAEHFRIGIYNKQIHPTGHCGFRFDLSEGQHIAKGSVVRCTVGPDRFDLINSPWAFGIGDPAEIGDQPMASPKLFFMHIAKTAGSSLNAFLASHYQATRVWTHLEGNQNWDPDFIVRNYDFLSGHLRIRKVGKMMNLAPYHKITLLRSPLDQLVSHLCWVRHISEDESSRFFRNHPEHIQALSLQLKATDFSDAGQLEVCLNDLNQEALNLFDNCQTRYFLEEQVEGQVGKSELDDALDCLYLFDLVGTVEAFPAFLAKLCAQLGWTYALPERKHNVQAERFGLDLGNTKTRQVLQSMVAYDMVLYREVQKINA